MYKKGLMDFMDGAKLASFILHSNHIEDEKSPQAFTDAMDAMVNLLFEFHVLERPVTHEMILEAHKRLLQHLDSKIAGKYRECHIQIGGQVKYFISTQLLKDEVQAWIDKWWSKAELNGDDFKQSHIEFENIHPFEDGNGRVGRMLWQLLRIKHNYAIEIIDVREVLDYYAWF
jgi:Fic family protein